MQNTAFDIDQLPLSPDEIDLERTVWDPAYRAASIQVLAREPAKTTDVLN